MAFNTFVSKRHFIGRVYWNFYSRENRPLGKHPKSISSYGARLN
jgi:hypothetical protein